jgi:Aspartyl protease
MSVARGFCRGLFRLCLVLSIVWVDGTTTATWADQEHTLWSHNGSVLYLVAKGTCREFYYKEPRPGMLQAGAHPGALLFRGQSKNHHYSGTAFVFSSRCGQLPYQVSGPILDGHEHVRLTGQKPEVGPDCSITGYFDDTLEFHLIKTLKEPPPDIGKGGQSILVPLKKEGGTYVVPVLINNAITLNFVVDSGASDVSVPADVVMTLYRTGTLEKPDFIGTQTYRLADGSTVPSATFRIRSLTVANTALENVTGSVAPVEGALPLGQSFLGRFKSWSIDNARQALVLEPQDGKTIILPKQTEQGRSGHSALWMHQTAFSISATAPAQHMKRLQRCLWAQRVWSGAASRSTVTGNRFAKWNGRA